MGRKKLIEKQAEAERLALEKIKKKKKKETEMTQYEMCAEFHGFKL